MTKVAVATKSTTTLPADSAPTSIVEARRHVEELALQEVERHRKLAPKKAELFAAQQAQDFQKAAVLREEVEYLDDVETGRQNRRAAILHLHLLQAQELEEGGAALEAEVTDRQAKAKAIFGKLEDLEGDVELRTRYFSDRTNTQQMAVNAAAMKQTARLLRHELKSDGVLDHGRVYGTTAEELIDGLMELPEVMGPTVASVYEWVAKRPDRGQSKHGQRMVMVWYGGRITELDWQGIILSSPREPVRK